jgi:hypothetical protein
MNCTEKCCECAWTEAFNDISKAEDVCPVCGGVASIIVAVE